MRLKYFFLLSLLIQPSSRCLSGNTWTNHGPASKVIKAVSISPQDTSVLYAGAFGWGMFKSTNAGSTWANQRNGLTNSAVRSVYALSNTIVFCGTNDGVFKTTDGGLSWTLSLVTSFSVRSLAYDSQTNSLYATTFGTGLFKSTNQGLSWSSISVTDPVVGQTLSHQWSVAVFGRDSLYVGGTLGDVTTGGALFRSLDGGASWIQVQRGIHIGSSVHSIAISPNNPDISLIIGTATKGVYKSTNGGLNWTNINGSGTTNPLVDNQINAVAFSAGYRYAGTDSVGGFFSRTLGDTTVGWIEGSGLPGSQAVVSSIALNRTNESTSYVGSEGQGVYRTVNSGFNWGSRNEGMLGIAARVIKRNGNGQLILGTDLGDGIWISSDQGNSWNKSTSLSSSNAITGIGITNNSSIIYAGTYGTGVYKSTDGGTTWVITDSTSINQLVRTLSVDPSNANLVYAGTENGAYKTVNGGSSWQMINNGIPPNTSIRSMALDSIHPNVLYLGTDSSFLFKSTDAGANWTNITSTSGFLAQDMFIRTITVDYESSNILYVGSDSGRIYKSTNAGNNWVLHAKLPATHSVRSILIHPNYHKVFFAATFGDGIYTSSDSGSNWVPMDAGLVDQDFYMFESDRANPLTLWAGSGSHGVYSMSFTLANHTPVLSPIGNKSVLTGNQLRFVVSASDSDLTIPSLAVTGLPSGASFTDSLNGRGLFVWTPTAGQIGTYTLTFDASDDVSSDSEKVTINVLDSSTSTVGTIPVQSGWNLLSVPVTETDYRRTVVFPQAVSAAFAYASKYVIKDTLQNGTGYWLKFRPSQDIAFGGGTMNRDTIAVNPGWNMVGSLSRTIPLGSVAPMPPVVITSHAFAFSGPGGYMVVDSIKPGRGYWIKVNQAGNVVMSSAPSQSPFLQGRAQPTQQSDPYDRIGVLRFRTTEGGTKELHLFSKQASSGAEEFELPPCPPEGSFDVRFSATQGSAVRVSSETTQVFPIRISASGHAVELSWNMHQSDMQFVLTMINGRERIVYRLDDEGRVAIPLYNGIANVELQIGKTNSGRSIIPKTFVLYQNYPNPFNPNTSITYDLLFPSFVKLTVFDILGRKTEELVRGQQGPGSQTVVWNGENMSSGIYYYTIEITNRDDPSKSYRDTKKMFLLR